MTTRSTDRPSRRLFPCLIVGVALGVSACKKDPPKAEASTKSEAKTADNGEETPEEAKEGGAEKASTAADKIAAAPTMARGSVLGHVMLPAPSSLMGKIKRQAAPPAAAMFLDVEFIKNMAGMQLGSPRGDVIKNIDFDEPFACVLVDTKEVDFPVACTLGYLGGAKSMISDLGTDGKQADAGGAKGHFVLEGLDLYIDDVGEAVVVANHPEAIKKAKPYLEANILKRAEENLSDIEAVAYVGAAMVRYNDKLQPLLETFGAPPIDSSANPIEKAFAEYALGTNRDNVERFRQMEQATLGLGFDKAGFTARWAVFAKEGSDLHKEMEAVAAGPVDIDFVSKLPENAAMVAAMRFDGQIGEAKSMKELHDVIVREYARELGKDEAAVNKAITDFFKEENELYGNDVAVSALQLPGSLGAIILEAPAEKPGRQKWAEWSESFGAKEILGEKASAKLTWEFKRDAATVLGVPIDRWAIKPTKEGLAKLEKENPENFKALKAKWKSTTITIDRAEGEGRVIFVVSFDGGEPYMKAAIAAAKGTKSLGSNPGFKTITSRSKSMSAMYAIDVKRTANALRTLIPAEAAAKIPADLGNDLGDAFFVNSYGKNGSQTGEFAISQGVIDQLRALAK